MPGIPKLFCLSSNHLGPPRMLSGRRTRSRTGCLQCVRVSRKCEETRPVCQRCERLGFACDYSPRFQWRPYNPINNMESSKALIPSGPSAVCECTNRLNETQLLDLFSTGGSRVLHWRGLPQSDLVGDIMQLCRQHAAIRYSVEALMSLCSECCNLSTLTRIDRAIDESKEFFNADLHPDNEALATCMVLLSQVAMRAGYSWTHQISQILEIETLLWRDDSIACTSDANQSLEVLGGLDMDVWIVGRQTKPLHIWATWCMGRQGIEPITGLPRPLLDLIARVSRKEDVASELRQFIATLPHMPTTAESLWRCFAVTALLCIEGNLRPCSVGNVTLELLKLLRVFISASTGEDNLHPLGWSAFELGIHIQDNSQGGMVLVDTILAHLFDQSGEGWRHPQGSLRSLMKQFWKERDECGHEIAYRTLQSRAVEIGLW